MKVNFSIIVPVYNRPKELDELLISLTHQDYNQSFEIVIVEDGSDITAQETVKKYRDLNIQYLQKPNSGPGLSRNYGMQRACGNYFIILDSDVLLPTTYLTNVSEQLRANFTDAFGGPDSAHPAFTAFQKAVNYSMTSFLTTGGIRGKKKAIGQFQPRSFNMGISKEAFERTGGFSEMLVGEDIDFTFRLWEKGLKTQLIESAFVYHKRRNTLLSFYRQTHSFGGARPRLTRTYPSTAKWTYWLPSLFIVGLDLAIIAAFFGWLWPLALYGLYLVAIFSDATVVNNSFKVGVLSVITSLTQMYGYGLGFLSTTLFRSQ